MSGSRGATATIALLAAALLTGCVDAMVGTIGAALEVERIPTGVTVPGDGEAIGRTDAVQIRFSDAMDPESLSLSGSLADVAHATEWQTVVFPNDTLVITPEAEWPLYATLELTAGATSRSGYRSGEVRTELTVVDETLYVSATAGDDDAIGSPGMPLRTITEAVTRARARADAGFAGTQRVNVAAGTYAEEIELSPTLELYGGYTENFSARTPGTSVVAPPAGVLTSVYLMTFDRGVFNPVIDGFEIREPPGEAEGALVLGGNYGEVVVRNCVLTAAVFPALSVFGALSVRLESSEVVGPSSGQVALFSQGAQLTVLDSTVTMPPITGRSNSSIPTVWALESLARIERSRIEAPRGEVGRAVAVQVQESEAIIRDSIVDGGAGDTTVAIRGIGATGSLTVVDLENVTIRVGDASLPNDASSVGIDFRYYFETDATGPLENLGVLGLAGNDLRVQNTIVFGTGATNSAGLIQGPTGRIRNNVFHGLEHASVVTDAFGNSTPYSAAGLDALEELLLSATGNQEVAPLLANPATLADAGADWRLTASSPEAVRRGGIVSERTGIVARDADGVLRGDVWAVGAYEYE